MTSAMTEPKITRDRIEHWREHLTYIEPLHADELSALCTLALQAEAMQPKKEQWTYGHCVEKQKPGGCQLHNLFCTYPDCDRRPAT